MKTRSLLLGLTFLFAACLDPGEPGGLVRRTVEEDPGLPRIEVNGTVLHAEAFGDPSRPMVVVLHGGPGGDYRGLLPYRKLADEGYYVVFWDHRGSGLSRRHDGASYTDFEPYLEDLRQVIEHFSSSASQPIVFIGHSWGAMYATWFINEHGDYGGRIAGAVLSEPGALTSDGLSAYLTRLMPPWGWTSEELNDLVWTDQQMVAVDHERADYLIEVGILAGAPREHHDPSRPVPNWRHGAVVNGRLLGLSLERGFDWTTHLGDYPRPVLFLRGELNENMPLEHQQELASHYANASVVTVPGVGHEGMCERPDDFLAHIRPYLSEVLP